MRTQAIRLTATGTVISGGGVLEGVWVNSGSSFNGIKIYDNTSAAGFVINNNTTPAIATSHFMFGMEATIGIHVVLTGTADITFYIRTRDV